MTEEQIDQSIAILAYYSKGRFDPAWIETLSYKRRVYFLDWLRKQLVKEHNEQKRMLGKI
jgi:hypothetical protein